MEGRNGDAVSLLERYLKDWADDSLHVKLAQVFAATNMLQDALLHYQAALRLAFSLNFVSLSRRGQANIVLCIVMEQGKTQS